MKFVIFYFIINVTMLQSYKRFISLCKHPPGKYCSFGSTYQFDCPKGHYCPKNEFYKSCPQGTYLDKIGMSELSDCVNCTQGYYCSRRGLELPNGLCDRGYYCPTGAKSQTEKACPVNHYCPIGSAVPIICKLGTHQPRVISWFCDECPHIEIFTNISSKIEVFGENVTFCCVLNVSLYDMYNITYDVQIHARHHISQKTLNVSNFIEEPALTIDSNQAHLSSIFFNKTFDPGLYIFFCSINSSQCGNTVKGQNFTLKQHYITTEAKIFAVKWYVIVIIISFFFVLFIVFFVLACQRNTKTCQKYDIKQNSDVNTNEKEMKMKIDSNICKSKLVSKQIHESVLFTTKNSDIGSLEDDDINHKEFDVFICYSSADRVWVKNVLLRELEAHGIKVCIDFRDFLVGAYIVENITDAIFNSKKTISVLSPDFLSSVYCKVELQQALSHMKNHQVIPILYRQCIVPTILQQKTYLQWCHSDVQPHFWDLLIKAIKSS